MDHTDVAVSNIILPILQQTSSICLTYNIAYNMYEIIYIYIMYIPIS